MKKVINYIFREIQPTPHIADEATTLLNVITNAGVFLFFLSISLLLFFTVGTITPKEAYQQRRAANRILAFMVLFCAISRGLTALAYWHNYYFLNGVFTGLTNICGIVLTAYAPFLIRSIKSIRQLDQVKATLEETSKKVDELKDISKKVLEKGKLNDDN